MTDLVLPGRIVRQACLDCKARETEKEFTRSTLNFYLFLCMYSTCSTHSLDWHNGQLSISLAILPEDHSANLTLNDRLSKLVVDHLLKLLTGQQIKIL